MSTSMKIDSPINDFASLTDEMLAEIARGCLLPKTNKHQTRQYPHSTQLNFQLLSVDRRGRNALLEILRREKLYIEVRYHECDHMQYQDPRELEDEDRERLGEASHPSLANVFGEPEWHPALGLKEAGQTIHTIQINIRCGQVCQKTLGSRMAFVPAQTEHILALCPILHRMQKPTAIGMSPGFIEIISRGADQQYPHIRGQIPRVINLIQNILPGSHHGALTPAIIQQAEAVLESFHSGEISAEEWPVIGRYFKRYLAELENLIAAGTPIHELASLVENFFNNKLFPRYGEHGLAGGHELDEQIDHETFLSILTMFNKYQCIFSDGMAEYLLRREATVEGQTHHIFAAISSDETLTFWAYFNRLMETNAKWADDTLNQFHNPRNVTKPSKEAQSLYLQACATRLTDLKLRFAMARARRCNPSLQEYQHLCYISQMATSVGSFHDETPTRQQLVVCANAVRDLWARIDMVMRTHKLATPEMAAMRNKARELLDMIEHEDAINPYHVINWHDGGFTQVHEEPVIRTKPGKYVLTEVEETDEVLEMIADMRGHRVFKPIRYDEED